MALVGIITSVVFLILFWALVIIFVRRGIKYTKEKKQVKP